MKRYALLSVAAALALGSAAQINAPDNSGLIARSRNMASMANYKGAIDRLDAVDRDALDADSRMAFDFERTGVLFADGRYEAALAAYGKFRSDYPTSALLPAASKGMADCLMALGDYGAAYDIYRETDADGLASDDAAELYYRLGVCAIETGHTAEAEKALDRAATYASTRKAAMFYLGKIDFDRKDYRRARERFKAAASATAPGDMADFYLASIDFAEGNYGKALTTARQMSRRHGLPTAVSAELNRIIGESLYRQGETTEATDYLERYVAAEKTPMPSALYILGIHDFARGDYGRALERLNPVTERGEGAMRQSAYLYVGQCLLEQGDSSAAILAFDKAAKADYDRDVREAALYNYTAARLSGASVPFASAAEALEDFLKAYPSGVYSDRVAEYLATGYMADNDYVRALERLDGIASPSPKTAEARQRVLYTLGTTALADGNIADAEKYLRRAETEKTRNSLINAETELSMARLAAAKGDNRGAAERFRKYLRTADKNAENRPVALYGLAYACYSNGDAAEAETCFTQAEKALADKSARADALNRLGDIRFAQADFSGAADFYRRAYSVNPATGDYAALNAAKMKGYSRDYEGKLRDLDAFRREFPSSALMPDALLETTQAQISLGRNDDAVATYRKLIADYPRTAQGRRGYLQMAMTLLDMNRKEDAAEAYRSVIRLYPTSEEAAQASSLLKTMYAYEGRADEYLEFMAGVDNAPKIEADEAERLSFESALTALRSRGETRQLEKFADKHPASRHAAEALGALLDNAVANKRGDEAGRLADRILERYPDSPAAEAALLEKARSLQAAGKLPEALEQYRALEEKASTAQRATEARQGIMRTARDLGDHDTAAEAADAILASSAATSAMTEAKYTKAVALDADDNTDAAIALWLELAADPSDIFGAKSAYEAAEALHDKGDDKKALDTARSFVQSGSPHRYWVARGFILLSDIYTAQGKKFEAREYLEALRDNYPGSEADIFMMIDSRLSNEKQ